MTDSSSLDKKKIPRAVIKRLSLYSRILQQLEMKKIEKVSSKELGERLGLNSAQVRKDLAYFGQFGVPGFGYYVGDLRRNIKKILGTDREIRVGLVGVGNLGSALLAYGGFMRQGFRLMAGFDSSKRKIGTERTGVPVMDVGVMEEKIKELAIDIMILAVPAEVAQDICDRVVKAGITAILNFVPTRLIVPDPVKVHYVDLAIEMESLSYYLH
jgi:redox-sensing transcriptional repressor